MSETSVTSLVPDASVPVLDEDQVSLLAPSPDDESNMFAELIEIFSSESEPRLKEIQSACAAQDAEALGKLVHFIGGSSANLGALRLSTLCREVETALGRGAFSDYDALPELIESEYREGLDALKQAATLN